MSQSFKDHFEMCVETAFSIKIMPDKVRTRWEILADECGMSKIDAVNTMLKIDPAKIIPRVEAFLPKIDDKSVLRWCHFSCQ